MRCSRDLSMLLYILVALVEWDNDPFWGFNGDRTKTTEQKGFNSLFRALMAKANAKGKINSLWYTICCQINSGALRA